MLNPLYEVTYRTQIDPDLQSPDVIVIDEMGILKHNTFHILIFNFKKLLLCLPLGEVERLCVICGITNKLMLEMSDFREFVTMTLSCYFRTNKMEARTTVCIAQPHPFSTGTTT